MDMNTETKTRSMPIIQMWVWIAYLLDARKKTVLDIDRIKCTKPIFVTGQKRNFPLVEFCRKLTRFHFLTLANLNVNICEISTNIRYASAKATNWSTKGAESIIFFRKLRPSISCAASDATQLAQAFKAYLKVEASWKKMIDSAYMVLGASVQHASSFWQSKVFERFRLLTFQKWSVFHLESNQSRGHAYRVEV